MPMMPLDFKFGQVLAMPMALCRSLAKYRAECRELDELLRRFELWQMHCIPRMAGSDVRRMKRLERRTMKWERRHGVACRQLDRAVDAFIWMRAGRWPDA